MNLGGAEEQEGGEGNIMGDITALATGALAARTHMHSIAPLTMTADPTCMYLVFSKQVIIPALLSAEKDGGALCICSVFSVWLSVSQSVSQSVGCVCTEEPRTYSMQVWMCMPMRES